MEEIVARDRDRAITHPVTPQPPWLAVATRVLHASFLHARKCSRQHLVVSSVVLGRLPMVHGPCRRFDGQTDRPPFHPYPMKPQLHAARCIPDRRGCVVRNSTTKQKLATSVKLRTPQAVLTAMEPNVHTDRFLKFRNISGPEVQTKHIKKPRLPILSAYRNCPSCTDSDAMSPPGKGEPVQMREG